VKPHRGVFTVALIGPDGAGKSTISRKVVEMLDIPAKYLYMGVNLEASNLMLPTTRLALELKRMRGDRPDAISATAARAKRRSMRGVRGLIYQFRAVFRLMNWIAEEWFRQIVAWIYQLRGYVVVFDRHFFPDYYASDIADGDPDRPFTSKVHGWILKNLYPRPDMMIMLDAPAEVLHARKREGTIESLEQRRQDYLEMRHHIDHFAIVSTEQPQEDAAREVAEIISRFAAGVKDERILARPVAPSVTQTGQQDT